jgi:adenosylhomocysteine nucleosidase
MELIRTISADRPLLVMAVKEEAQSYHGDLPLLLTGVGKVNAAAALAAVLARRPRPSYVINVGTAGALRAGWAGTHAIGTVIQHDLDSDLLRQLTGETWGPPFTLVDRDGPTLATGDVFVSDPGVRERLAARAALVDMEGYALASASAQAGVPIRIVKHVSDDASAAAVKTWPASVAESARALAQWIALNIDHGPGPGV